MKAPSKASVLRAWKRGIPGKAPRHNESEQISLRMPKKLLEVIRAFAKRKRTPYQVLLKDWLHDRAEQEARKFLGRPDPNIVYVMTGNNLGPRAEDLVDDPGNQHRVRKADRCPK